MSMESTKTRMIRGDTFEHAYLSGRVIDVGCGPDLVVPHAEPFDLEHGDAGRISTFREPLAYDAVHSSHCLEHMEDVPTALAEWWKLVRPGGYLVVVVPEEDLYEQGIWPSLFNDDHKATFRLRRPTSWSPVSYDIGALFDALPNVAIVSEEVQDQNYDRRLKVNGTTWFGRTMFRASHHVRRAIRAAGFRGLRSIRAMDRLFRELGIPVDQLEGDAVAQIQVVAWKQMASGA